MNKRISELKPGEKGSIVNVGRDDALGIRLMEMGLTPETEVRFIRQASSRGPFQIFVRGYEMTIGFPEARIICVQAQ